MRAILLLSLVALLNGCVCVGVAPVRLGGAEKPAGPVRHVVLLKFKPETPDAARRAVEEALGQLPKQIDEILAYEWGTDLNNAARSEGYTHCLIMTFADAAAVQAYLVDPAHQAFLQMARPHIEKLLVLDFEPGTAP